MIEKLETFNDFKNKKILYSDEVLKALYAIDRGLSFKEWEVEGIEIHSLYIDSDLNLSLLHFELGLDCFIEFKVADESEMFYLMEHGFYVEVEDD